MGNLPSANNRAVEERREGMRRNGKAVTNGNAANRTCKRLKESRIVVGINWSNLTIGLSVVL